MSARVLLVGAGGLGCAAGLALARAGVPLAITIVDADVVDVSNLQRQVLFVPEDAGRPKAEQAARRIVSEARSRGLELRVEARIERLEAHNARALVAEHDLVIEGTDRHATKFLAGDAAMLAGVPSVHAGIVRWSGWALAVAPGRSGCLRCLFEDVPDAPVATCAEAGVVGPAVGVLGHLQAALALRILEGDASAAGVVHRFDAWAGRSRSTPFRPRESCELCGRRIVDLDPARYAGPGCAA